MRWHKKAGYWDDFSNTFWISNIVSRVFVGEGVRMSRTKNKLTLKDPKTYEERECSVVEHLEEYEFYPFSDRGELEQMKADINSLKTLVFILTDFIEEKHGHDFVKKFLGSGK